MGNTALGQQIKKLRTANKMTLSALANRLGVTASTVSAYENATRFPSYDVLIRISKLFNVSIDHLLGNASSDTIDVSTLTYSQRREVESLVLTFKKLNWMSTEAFGLNTDDTDLLESCLDNDLEQMQQLLKKK